MQAGPKNPIERSRLCAYRLQATGDTAQDAIEALYQKARQYTKVYGTRDLGEAPHSVPPQVPLRVADELAAQEQRADIERARWKFGLWHGASTVDHIILLYLQLRMVHGGLITTYWSSCLMTSESNGLWWLHAGRRHFCRDWWRLTLPVRP